MTIQKKVVTERWKEWRKNYIIYSTLHNFSNELAIIMHEIRRVFQTSVYETINKKSYFIAIVLVVYKRSLVSNYFQAQRG